MNNFAVKIKGICAKDNLYPEEAYYFVRDLTNYVKKKKTEQQNPKYRDVSIKDYKKYLIDFCLEKYDGLANLVLTQINITSFKDIGDIIKNLISYGLMQESQNDDLNEFLTLDFELSIQLEEFMTKKNNFNIANTFPKINPLN